MDKKMVEEIKKDKKEGEDKKVMKVKKDQKKFLSIKDLPYKKK